MVRENGTTKRTPRKATPAKKAVAKKTVAKKAPVKAQPNTADVLDALPKHIREMILANAGGDVTRISVISHTEIIIHNHPKSV